MLDSVMQSFNLRPQYDLDIMQTGQTLHTITTRALNGLASIIEQCKPDIILVHGDTSTAFAGALAAFYAKTPLGHVEAGLRSGDNLSPYPEEMNRKLISQLAKLHFSPTAQNAENLKREGITENVFITGNTVIDALKHTTSQLPDLFGNVLDKIDWANRRVVTLTCHRRENYGEPMENIFHAIRELVEKHEDIELVYPVHLAPAVQKLAQQMLGDHPRIHLIAPLDALAMHALMAKSYLILTDSGGIQEEAPALGKPVLVLRRETERPEAIEAGTVLLAGTDKDSILRHAETLLTDANAYAKMAKAINPYGDGTAAKQIVDAIVDHFSDQTKPNETDTND